MRGITTRFVSFGVLLLALAMLTGCPIARHQPIYNVQDRSFPDTVAQNLTLDQVAEAITLAGDGRLDSWKFERTGANSMLATIDVRSHHAEAILTFDLQKFSIVYEDSDNLLYTGPQIHRNYNKWVENLENDILREVTLAARR